MKLNTEKITAFYFHTAIILRSVTGCFFLLTKFIVTAALPYANGDLHLGGVMSTYLPADIYSRFLKLKGIECNFVCATDEHGAPIEINAAKQEMSPKEFVDFYHERQEKDFKKLGVLFDVFHSTHSPENERLSQEFYLLLKEKGLIFKKKVLQTYCEKDKRVLPDRYVKGKCPFCKAEDQYGDSCEKCGKAYSTDELLEPYCVLCKSKPVKQEVEHSFFRLSKFGKSLEKWFEGKQGEVVNYVKNWLKDLQDWDITRDGPYFGIQIPGEENQFFYVWFDAPNGYIASLEKLTGKAKQEWATSKIVHFIGKDITYHHYLFWPAVLEGVGWKKPDLIPTRGYLTVEGEKMSKSRGTFVLLKDVLEKAPPDFLRYYLTSITPNNTSDVNFSWKDFSSKVNNELVNSLGNYFNRTLSFINSKYHGKVPSPGTLTAEDKEFEEKIDSLYEKLDKKLDEVELKAGLEELMSFVSDANKYFNASEPWKKEGKARDSVMYLNAKAASVLAVAMAPFLPNSSEEILKQISLKKQKWGFKGIKGGHVIGTPKPLYQKMEIEKTELEKAA